MSNSPEQFTTEPRAINRLALLGSAVVAAGAFGLAIYKLPDMYTDDVTYHRSWTPAYSDTRICLLNGSSLSSDSESVRLDADSCNSKDNKTVFSLSREGCVQAITAAAHRLTTTSGEQYVMSDYRFIDKRRQQRVSQHVVRDVDRTIHVFDFQQKIHFSENLGSNPTNTFVLIGNAICSGSVQRSEQ